MREILDELKEEIREIRGCFLLDAEGELIDVKSIELRDKKEILSSIHYLTMTVREKKDDLKKLFLDLENGRLTVYFINHISLGILTTDSINPVMLDMIVKNKKKRIEEFEKNLEREIKLKYFKLSVKEIAFKKLGNIGETIVEKELEKISKSGNDNFNVENFLENVKKSASLLVGSKKATEAVEEIRRVLGGE